MVRRCVLKEEFMIFCIIVIHLLMEVILPPLGLHQRYYKLGFIGLLLFETAMNL